MPNAWQVTLSEALYIQSRRLDEQQIWAILSEAIQALQDIFCRGEAMRDGAPSLTITPESLCVCRGGNVEYSNVLPNPAKHADFIPPELDNDELGPLTIQDVEKMYVFSLGLTIYWAADYKLGSDEDLELGELLDQVLSAMCEENPDLRVSLDRLSQVCQEYREQNPSEPPNAWTLRQLYQLLMGSCSDLDNLERVHRANSYKSRSRPERKHSNHRSRSRSRSRSQSRSRDTQSHHRKRPHPIGRDHTSEGDQMSTHSSAHKRYPVPPAQYVTMLPAQDYIYPYYSGYVGNIPTTPRHHSEIQPHMYDSLYKGSAQLPPGIIPPPAQWAAPGLVYVDANQPPGPHKHAIHEAVRRREMQDTYKRLQGRGARLQALRHGLDLEDVSDITSLYSDLTDAKPATSHSSTHGVFVPDMMIDPALVRNPIFSANRDPEADWIRKQEADIEAMLLAQNAFIKETRNVGDGAFSEHGSTVAPSMAGSGYRRQGQPQRESRSRYTSSTQTRKASKSRERSKSRPRQKAFYGPEFVRDHGLVTVHTSEARTLPPGKVRHLEVILLTGQRLDVICDVDSKARDVKQAVTSHLNLPEAFYFGLTYIHENEHLFLDVDAPVHKVAPKVWRTQNIGSFTLHLRIKFYTDTLGHLRNETTRHLYYLQVRRDLLEERLWCTPSQAVLLSALAIQAEYGDLVLHHKRSWAPEHYVAPRLMRRVGKAFIRDQVTEKLHLLVDMNDLYAEIQFLKEAMLLSEYGIHFYHIHKSKSETTVPLWVGISVKGILISELETGGDRRVIHRLAWPDTQKVSYNKRRFSIQPKPDPIMGKLPKLNFFTETYKKCRYLTDLCTSHHHFQMMSRLNAQTNQVELNEDDMLYGEADDYMSSPEDSPRQEDMETDDENTPPVSAANVHPTSHHTAPGRKQATPRTVYRDDKPAQPVSRTDHDTVQTTAEIIRSEPDTSTPRHELRVTDTDSIHDNMSDMGLGQTPDTNVDSAHVLDVLDTSIVPLSEMEDQDLLQYRAQVRKLEIVRLSRDPQLGFGVTIVGGNNTGKLDFGIFVKSVTPRSPADRCGKVHSGDRVLAVNGHSLEGVAHSVAVEMIRDSAQMVELTLSQNMEDLGVNLQLAHSTESLNITTAERNIVISAHSKVGDTRQADDPDHFSSARRPSSVGSLELEDVVPPELLHKPVNLENITHNMRLAANISNFADTSDDELTSYHDNSRISNHRPGSSTSSQMIASSSRVQSGRNIQPGEQYELILEKKQKSFGLNVTGGTNTSVKQGGIYVKSMNKDGAAEQNGVIQIGDRVLEVDGVSLLRVTHAEAVETLRSAPSPCKLIMERSLLVGRHSTVNTPIGRGVSSRPSSIHSHTGLNGSFSGSVYAPYIRGSQASSSPHTGKDLLMEYYPFVTKDNLLEVVLQKWSSGLGFSVLGGTDVHPDPLRQVVRIKKIFPTGPASSQGELHEGDVILEVNDTMTRGLKHQEVMNLLRTAPDDVTLLVCRPSDMDLPRIQTVASELELLGTTSPIPQVNTGALAGPATYSDIDDLTSQSEQPPGDESLHDSSDPGHSSDEDRSDHTTSVQSQVSNAHSNSVNANNSQTPDQPEQLLFRKTPTGKTDVSSTPNSLRSSTPTEQNDDHTSYDGDDDNDDNEYEISLTKGEKGLGFTVAGSHHIDGYFYVKDVLYDPALSSDMICSGHRLLVVDGQDMTTLTHREAVAYLRQTPSTVTLRFYIPTESERKSAEAKAPSSISTKINVFNRGDQPESTSTPRQSMDPFNTDKQHMSSGAPFNQTTVNTSKSLPHTPSDELDPSCNSDLHPVSQKLSVLNISNNSSGNLEDESCHEPEISSARSHKSEDRNTPNFESGLLRVSLRRSEQGYGFSLIHGEKGPTSALYVRSITPGGSSDGKINIGDRLLQVNGESVIGMAHNKAVTLIKNSGEHVQLTLTRSTPSSTPTPVFDIDKATPDSARRFPQPISSQDPVMSVSQRIHTDIRESHDDETADSRLSKEGQLAFQRLVQGQRRTSETDTDASWGHASEEVEEELPPSKPPRKNPSCRLPTEITDKWLESLPLVTPSSDSVHFSGRQLQVMIKQLRSRLVNDEALEEYKILKHAKLTDNCLEARKADNKSKNRYRNVLPYDTNRVCLSGAETYINASHICATIGKEPRRYIASQGPLPNTTDDFWRMVWEQKVEVIAMVTRDVEDNKVKCHHYWPDVEPLTVADRYEVSLVQAQHLENFDVHHIKMEDRETGSVHRVVHSLYGSWPDQGVPDSGVPLLRYIKFLRLAHQSGPILVHCSAGIGRTGVLITIDVILAMIDKDIKYDIQKIVQDLRRQRRGMIQVKDQYKFCYQAAMEALESLCR